MPIRYLVNEDGSPFDPAELGTIRRGLEALKDLERRNYRDANAQHIAQHKVAKMLVVSGPGTGKSTLFKQKILHWLEQNPEARILAVSFVRKLVADLAADIAGDKKLTDGQKGQVEVLTLHGYARSLVEKNHGTSEVRFRPHFKIIGESWKEVVWNDVLNLVGQSNAAEYAWRNFEEQLHNNVFDTSAEWNAIQEQYSNLSSFYNAAGFADLILRAKDALEENPYLEENDFFIVDEYQDFNQSEELLIRQVTKDGCGILIVGDDDQVLYEKLKAGRAALIRALYQGDEYGNGMLPFCGRCGQHIVESSAHFISNNADADCIEKIYLPLEKETEATKVNVIACAAPQAAVDYIRKFIDDHKDAILERKEKLESGEKKDAFLLILTPSKGVGFYNKAAQELFQLVGEYKNEDKALSEDYFRALSYYALGKQPSDNFSFRKVLYYEGVSPDIVCDLIRSAMAARKNLFELNELVIKSNLEKAKQITAIFSRASRADEKMSNIVRLIKLNDPKHLSEELADFPIGVGEGEEIGELKEEEDAELAETEVQRMSSVELMTIVGSKGLSADHVIIIGFDNVNMHYVSKNAFYVAMTRARKSLHLITALGSGGANSASSYLNHLPEENLGFYKYKKGKQQIEQIRNRAYFNGYLKYILELKSGSGKKGASRSK